MTTLSVRPALPDDFAAWKPLWDGYNAFYGRSGETALPNAVTQATWHRFFDPAEPVFALVAEFEGTLVGLAHHLFHRSTTRLALTCYLQDLFTAPSTRGRGIGRVYWTTHESNAPGRLLYDKVASHAGFIIYVHEL